MPRNNTPAGDVAREQILDYINSFTRKYGIPPTMRQITADLEISSTSVTFYHLRQLKDQGKVYRVGEGRSSRYMPSNARVVFYEQ